MSPTPCVALVHHHRAFVAPNDEDVRNALTLEGLTPTMILRCSVGSPGSDGTGENWPELHRQQAAWMAEQFLRTTKGDPVALLGIIDTFADTPIEAIRGFRWPIAVVCGAEDQDNGSAPDLAAAVPDGRYIEVPGGHMSSVVKPELGQAIAGFLAA